MSKDGDEKAKDGEEKTKDGEAETKEGEAKEGDTKEGEAKDGDAKKADGDAKKADGDAKKADGDAKKPDAKEDKEEKPVKPQRERISPEYLNCLVCNVINMKSEQTFSEHTRGRRHQQMMALMDQKLEQTAKLIRLEVQVAARRAEQEAQRRSAGKVLRESGFCGMCNVKVYKDIQEHRFHDPMHIKLKRLVLRHW